MPLDEVMRRAVRVNIKTGPNTRNLILPADAGLESLELELSTTPFSPSRNCAAPSP